MLALVDTHVHLLAGLDDGPRSSEEALEMCRLAAEDGVGTVLATAHQNDQWPDVTPQRVRDAAGALAAKLAAANVPLRVEPTAEVTLGPDLLERWDRGELLSVADAGKYLMVEFPNDTYVDLLPVLEALRGRGTGGPRLIIAHAERTEELLQERGLVEELIARGCLIQLTSRRVVQPRSAAEAKTLRDWVRRGIVHLVGSDGHDLTRRPPVIQGAYQQIAKWTDTQTADRLCARNGLAVANGETLEAPSPRRRRWWLWKTR